jgi:small subunit ribosomal protein S6
MRPFFSVGGRFDLRGGPGSATGRCYIRSLAGLRVGFLMPSDATVYDLVLLLSLESDEDARAKVLSDVESAITAVGGSVSRNQAWGRRPTAFPIRHQSEAEYHLLQFSGPTSLLDSLSHSLGIADQVLRFRIIKVLPGTPPAPESAPPVLVGTHSGTAESELAV